MGIKGVVWSKGLWGGGGGSSSSRDAWSSGCLGWGWYGSKDNGSLGGLW